MMYRTREEISDQLISYIQEKSDALRDYEVPVIERHIDSESLNPLMLEYLVSKELTEILKEVKSETGERIVAGFAVKESIYSFAITPQFKKLKRMIRMVFCQFFYGRKVSKQSSPRYLIYELLVVLLSVFKSGIHVVILPIIIGMTAICLKRGYSYLCLQIDDRN